MNNHKFAFIICTNNKLFLDECLYYLSYLEIPPNYTVEYLTIPDAPSIAAGYNEGMASSDAKYKIYMHQDVFLINHHFLYDILSIFESDSSIGMIGMVGYPKVSLNGCMWYEKRVGACPLYGANAHAYSHASTKTYQYSLTKDGISDVALIDGLMMITSTDLPWDENLLRDWDFYDAFQSINYLEHGYRIVAPNQTLPWFIHDDGKFLSMWNYNKYRKLFLKKYSHYLGKSYQEILNNNKKEITNEHTTL